ncbi:MAG: 1-acyl-sn-glycerol-3-phosphate acyltransferase [Sandaracinaceae bacterium]|nr:1-acyl-sn-glycerol-3-phosphate acyltransferase [Sandaracinaceae bacterium]
MLPQGRLALLDRIPYFDPSGGRAGLGAARAETDVDAGAWFFRAHFFQDPVQPGSLGIEAMLSLLRASMLAKGLHGEMRAPRFRPVALGRAHRWKYRGQVLPSDRRVAVTLEITAIEASEGRALAEADASFWIDEKRIYEATLAVELVDDAEIASRGALPPPLAGRAGGGVHRRAPRLPRPLPRPPPARGRGSARADPSTIRGRGALAPTPARSVGGSARADPSTIRGRGALATTFGSVDGRAAPWPARGQLDLEAVARFWRGELGVDRPWLAEDLYLALLARFVSGVHVDDAAHAVLRRGPALYLASHQTAIETLMLSVAMGALSGVPLVTLAKKEHRTSWLGALLAWIFAHPDVREPELTAYFDREDPASLPALLASLPRHRSILVHAEGTRARSCRDPVSRVGSAPIELAIARELPIVPVRFTGGLPVEPAAEKLDFPHAMGAQAIHVGAPILAEELRALPSKARLDRARDAIEALGPARSRRRRAPAISSSPPRWRATPSITASSSRTPSSRAPCASGPSAASSRAASSRASLSARVRRRAGRRCSPSASSSADLSRRRARPGSRRGRRRPGSGTPPGWPSTRSASAITLSRTRLRPLRRRARRCRARRSVAERGGRDGHQLAHPEHVGRGRRRVIGADVDLVGPGGERAGHDGVQPLVVVGAAIRPVRSTDGHRGVLRRVGHHAQVPEVRLEDHRVLRRRRKVAAAPRVVARQHGGRHGAAGLTARRLRVRQEPGADLDERRLRRRLRREGRRRRRHRLKKAAAARAGPPARSSSEAAACRPRSRRTPGWRPAPPTPRRCAGLSSRWSAFDHLGTR